MTRASERLYSPDTLKLEILTTPINRLGYTIEGTFLEEAIRVVRGDMKRVGITKLQPLVYLSNGYGCIEGLPNISVSFTDCNDLIGELNEEFRHFRYTPDELIDTLRHEAGHAFCYAYKLFRTPEFRRIFKVKGHFFRTYPATNQYVRRVNPWSKEFVNPSGDYYAQKHPDDDFAETFMVLLQPRYNWRRAYRNYPGALRKLEFVKGIIEEFHNQEPLIDQKPYDYEPLESFSETVAHFMKLRSTHDYRRKATGYLDPDLKDLFWRPPASRAGRKRERDYVHADNFIRKHKRNVVSQVSRWVDVDERVVKDLLDKCSARTHALDLWVRKDERDKKLLEFTSYVSFRCALYALNESYLNGKRPGRK